MAKDKQKAFLKIFKEICLFVTFGLIVSAMIGIASLVILKDIWVWSEFLKS